LIDLIEGGDAALEQRTAILRRLDPLRTAVEQRHAEVCSTSAIAREMAGWVTASRVAAFAMLPVSATARRISSWRNLSLRRV
jgi:hypothetical protein